MAFTGKEGEVVTLADAARWTGNYRTANPGQVKAHFFGKDQLRLITSQTGCVGIRMYHAIDDDGAKVLVLVGVDANEKDMTSGVILERGMSCPPLCDTTSALNV